MVVNFALPQFAIMKSGECLITAEPFVYILSNFERKQRCDFCLEKFDSLSRCSQCKFARYCSRNCQVKAWLDHKKECIALRHLAPNVPTDSVRLMARIIWKLQNTDTSHETFFVDGIPNRCFEDLMTHAEEIKHDVVRQEQFAHIAHCLRMYMDLNDIPGPRELLHIFGRMVINSYTITDREMNPVGVGLYRGPSMLNHSCVPNVVTTFIGPLLQQRVIVDIPGNDYKLASVSYVDLLQTTQHRQKALKEQYYFDCNCLGCADYVVDALKMSAKCGNHNCSCPITKSSESFLSCQSCGFSSFDNNYYELWQKAEIVSDDTLSQLSNKNCIKMSAADVLKLCQDCLKVQLSIYHRLNVKLVQVLDKALDAAIELQKWELALQYGAETLDCYRRFYPSYDPNTGRQLMKIGKLELYLGNFKNSLQHLEQAEAILLVCVGKDYSLVIELSELLDQCRCELSVQQQ